MHTQAVGAEGRRKLGIKRENKAGVEEMFLWIEGERASKWLIYLDRLIRRQTEAETAHCHQ